MCWESRKLFRANNFVEEHAADGENPSFSWLPRLPLLPLLPLLPALSTLSTLPALTPPHHASRVQDRTLFG